jgi:hypothetical protein
MLFGKKVCNDFASVCSRNAPALLENHFQLIPPPNDSRCNFASVPNSNFLVLMVPEFHEDFDFCAYWQGLIQANLCLSSFNCFQPSFKYIHALSGPI